MIVQPEHAVDRVIGMGESTLQPVTSPITQRALEPSGNNSLRTASCQKSANMMTDRNSGLEYCIRSFLTTRP